MRMSNWTIFSNHGHVLVCLARDSEARLRDVAADVGLTERAVQKIVRDLQDGGMISVSKHGRRNHYRIDNKQNLRHDLEAHCTLGALTALITSGAGELPAIEPAAAPVATPVATPSSRQDSSPDLSPEPKPESKPSKPEADNPNKRQQGSLF